VSERGEIEESSLPEKTPAWQKQIVKCVLERVQFVPETLDSRSASASATLPIAFDVTGEGEARMQRVSALGPMLTPARFREGFTRILGRCLSGIQPDGGIHRVVMTMTILPTGAIKEIEIPAGAAPWVKKAADCLKGDSTFFPGTRDGVPVESRVSVPIVRRGDEGSAKYSSPKPPTDTAMIEQAYRTCYPPDQAAMGSVYFSFDVNVDGSISNAKIVRSSGDPALDRAGKCMLPHLRFTPMMRGSKPVKASITWELPVRPPR
jgi:TonB family protein